MSISPRALELLQTAHERAGSLAVVAREIGYSKGAVSALLNGKYKAKDPGAVEAAIIAAYGAETVKCPVLLEEISLAACRKNSERPFSSASEQAVRLWQGCKNCKHNLRRE